MGIVVEVPVANRYWDRERKEWVWAELIESPRNVSLGGDTGDVVWGRAGEWEVEFQDGSRQVYGARTFESRCRLEAPNYVEQLDLNQPVIMDTFVDVGVGEPKLKLGARIAVSPVLFAVAEERFRQDEKWGVQNHDPYYWYTILGEEFGEVGKALCEIPVGKHSWGDYRKELIQLAAVAVSMVESLDRGNIADGTAQHAPDHGDQTAAAGTPAVGTGGGVPGVSGTLPLLDNSSAG